MSFQFRLRLRSVLCVSRPVAAVVLLSCTSFGAIAAPAIVLNEIHYHPVERPAFDGDGFPVLDLSHDVHEFIEIYNAGPTNVSLAGWRLSGDVTFDFPTNAALAANRYLVIARDPARLTAITQYALAAGTVLGPYEGNLGNRNGTIRLRDSLDATIDAVSYSAEFPWAIGADSLGADDEWTGLVSSNFQYRGRSLERVSSSWTANDPANWLASPAPGNPSPGRVNAVVRAVPRPVVTAFAAYQASTGSTIIRANQSVRVDCVFSGTTSLSGVVVEYFLEDLNVTNEPRTTATMGAMGPAGSGQFTVTLPGRPDRTLVRYRIRANRGSGLETVSPRADDPFAWHSYFVTPVRSSTNRIYDCFISTASLNTLATNLNPANPDTVDISVYRRVQLPDPPGIPSRTWNATEPAVFVADGVVYDAQARYHGSQYRRSPANNSWKWQFPRYKRFENREGIFISDNGDETVALGLLYRLAGVPQSYTRWFDFYLNTQARIVRMDQDEMDDSLVERFLAEQRVASPQLPQEGSGEFYKSQGNFLFSDPIGPFGYGGYRILPAVPPYWTELQRYEHTYGLQMNGWKGHRQFLEMLRGMWSARGDSPTAVNPNITNLRNWLTANFDVDTSLASMAIRVWSGGWDNFNHNHFTWRRDNGKWAILQWDFDAEMDLSFTNSTIFASEFGAPLNYPQFGVPPAWVDANWLNDSFFKAFRQEYRRKLWILNNTLLNPTNLTALGLGAYRTFADPRFGSVNSQLALGAFQRPRTPTNLAPARLQSVFPPSSLMASAYSHPATLPPAHGSTTWWIRSTNGSYAAPLFKTTSTSNLTSLPIPFDQLTFGQTYYWRCAYTDTNGVPSLESPETEFIYGAAPSFVSLIAIDDDTLWRFNTNGAVLPTDWRTVGFDDSTWSEGQPLIGDDTDPLPEALRTPIMRGNRLVTYFRKTFVFNGNTNGAYLRIRHVVDDGVVVWLNGAEIHRIGLAGAPGTVVGNSTPASRSIINADYEGPFIVSPTNLNVGVNVLAVSVHRISTVSLDTVFGLSLEVAVPPAPGSVVLNEILADNRDSVTNGMGHPDYVELYNNTDQEQSLVGLSLSDNVQRPGKFVFPAGTVIAPRGRLMVWCDNETNAPGLHAGFALDNDGQTVALFTLRTNGYVLADSVTFGLQIPDYSIGRSEDGTGAWVLTRPTPGAEHMDAIVGLPDLLKVNEWMATDAGSDDWLELYNPTEFPVSLAGLSLTDNTNQPAKSVIPPLSFIGAEGFRQILADERPELGARHADFRLSGNGERIALYDAALTRIDLIEFGPQSSGVSEGRLPDGQANIVSFPSTASPEESNHLPIESIVINEVLAHSDPPLEDAVELLNLTDTDVDVGGWWLSDDANRLRKYRIEAGTTIPAHGFLTIYENQFNANPATENSFAFNSAHGDDVYLSTADLFGTLTGLRTEAHFGPTESGVSVGRFATSQGVGFVALSRRTFGVDQPGSVEEFRTGTGGSNAYARVGPVIISEIQYHPRDLAGGADNDLDEFIELRNLTGAPVSLFNPLAGGSPWRLRDAVDYTFPPGTTLQARETVLVVGFDPATNAAALSAFREAYGPVAVRLFGPWSGKLDNSSESIELVKPDNPVSEPGLDFGYVPSILVERVEYSERFPWPEDADGSGFSLMRDVGEDYGDDPLNWFAWFPTPGRTNVYNEPPVITSFQPSNGDVFTGPTDIVLSLEAVDADGSVLDVEFYDGTNRLGRLTSAPFALVWTNASFGRHTVSARVRDNGYAVIYTTPVNIRVGSQPPVVAITSPVVGGRYIASNTVAITVTATDPDTPILSVEFRLDGTKLAELATPPYTTAWMALPGSHVITALATDSSGTISTSAPVEFFVQSVRYSDSVIVPVGSSWRYLDDGSNPSAFWTSLNFVDTAWGTGFAELGFGDLDEATVIRRTINGVNSIGFYFRLKFVLNSVADVAGGRLSILRDDGAIAYLNGVEVFRDNMPAGPVNNLTPAVLAIGGTDEFTFYTTTVNSNRFVLGTNILAVEVHQSSTTSTDVSFDADLRVTRANYGPAITTQPQGQNVSPGGTATFSVVAIGNNPLFYQWRYNGAALPGQISATLVLNNVQAAQAGDYSVTVSNSIAAITSKTAVLSVGGQNQDTDGDGLPDEWEVAFGFNPLDGGDRTRDPDGDRASNYDEYIAGTNPTNALSCLKLRLASHGKAGVLTFAAAPNTGYTLEFKDQLGPGAWTTVTEVGARTTNRTAIVVDPSTGQSRFYRLATPASKPDAARILSVALGRATVLTFDAVSNRNYVVEFSDGFGAGPWRTLDGVPARSTNHVAVVNDTASTSGRYYRLVIPPGN